MIVAVELDRRRLLHGLSPICHSCARRFTAGDTESLGRSLLPTQGLSLVIPRRYSRSAVTETGTPLVSDSNTGEYPGPS